MLQDRFGRRFHYLRLSITDVCNFRCEYCLPDGYQCEHDRQFMSLEEIHTLVQTFAALGTSKIRITGGEPVLRKDLPDILALCANTPGINTLAMTTNGHQLSRKVSSWVDAGLTHLNVSIDSLDPRVFHTITGHDSLQEILSGIELAQSLGLKVKVNAVLLKQRNQDALPQFLDWLKDKPITLRLIELMQTGENTTFFNQQHLRAAPIKEQLLGQGWSQILKDKTAGPAEEFFHPDYQGKIGLIMPYGPEFCSSCNRLRVSSLGKLHLCLFADRGIDLRQYLQTGDVEGLTRFLQTTLQDKQATHWLDEGYTGATKHLAMLGG